MHGETSRHLFVHHKSCTHQLSRRTHGPWSLPVLAPRLSPQGTSSARKCCLQTNDTESCRRLFRKTMCLTRSGGLTSTQTHQSIGLRSPWPSLPWPPSHPGRQGRSPRAPQSGRRNGSHRGRGHRVKKGALGGEGRRWHWGYLHTVPYAQHTCDVSVPISASRASRRAMSASREACTGRETSRR